MTGMARVTGWPDDRRGRLDQSRTTPVVPPIHQRSRTGWTSKSYKDIANGGLPRPGTAGSPTPR